MGTKGVHKGGYARGVLSYLYLHTHTHCRRHIIATCMTLDTEFAVWKCTRYSMYITQTPLDSLHLSMSYLKPIIHTATSFMQLINRLVCDSKLIQLAVLCCAWG